MTLPSIDEPGRRAAIYGNFPGFRRLGNFLVQLDLQNAVFIGCGTRLHMISEAELPLK